ncbi:hypothetical protein DDQ41_26280 [Streptomyces spongiicola]|uniref:Glycosyl hydrolase family protein n=1 Tax=Streptomyces spongiicola TaxID=1690221 RepID=A0ABM6VD52_9ACTN|nr:hypothetical protein DDQ41_26280 [Streptomyces spongiicola]
MTSPSPAPRSATPPSPPPPSPPPLPAFPPGFLWGATASAFRTGVAGLGRPEERPRAVRAPRLSGRVPA